MVDKPYQRANEAYERYIKDEQKYIKNLETKNLKNQISDLIYAKGIELDLKKKESFAVFLAAMKSERQQRWRKGQNLRKGNGALNTSKQTANQRPIKSPFWLLVENFSRSLSTALRKPNFSAKSLPNENIDYKGNKPLSQSNTSKISEDPYASSEKLTQKEANLYSKPGDSSNSQK